MDGLTFNRMRRRHLNRVLNIEAEVFPRPWALALFMAELSMPRQRSYFVAQVGHEIVGYAGLMFNERECHLTNLGVTSTYQGHGIGTKLFYVLIAEASARESAMIGLEVRQSNRPARGIYERFGFQAVDKRSGYYLESGEDAVVMVLDAPASEEYRARLAELAEPLGPIPGDWSQPVAF